jgi:UDP-N-acetylmuramoyl-tripeptide--D-alanyl-D-alanine ligase
VPVSDAIKALEELAPGDKRGQLLTWNGATVINDSYNSNPEALLSMIQALAARSAQRRILVAGEMLELGEFAPSLHAECGQAAAQAGIDVIIGVRGNAEQMVLAATDAGVPGVSALFLPDAESAGQWLRENLKDGDVALVKGSRGVRLERAIAALHN